MRLKLIQIFVWKLDVWWEFWMFAGVVYGSEHRIIPWGSQRLVGWPHSIGAFWVTLLTVKLPEWQLCSNRTWQTPGNTALLWWLWASSGPLRYSGFDRGELAREFHLQTVVIPLRLQGLAVSSVLRGGDNVQQTNSPTRSCRGQFGG